MGDWRDFTNGVKTTAEEAIAADQKRPVLYDAHGTPLVRPLGFRKDAR